MLGAVRFRFPVLTLFFRVLTVTGQGTSWGIAIALLAPAIYFGLVHFPSQILYLQALVAPGFAWILIKAMKRRWRRPRPFQTIVDFKHLSFAPLDDSFPSGHSGSAFAFLFAILPFADPVVIALATVWAVLIATSRWYLGVHYPSDIFVGVLIGSLAGAIHPFVFTLLRLLPTFPIN